MLALRNETMLFVAHHLDPAVERGGCAEPRERAIEAMPDHIEARAVDAFARAGVKVLRGDWTRRESVITRFLETHGAAGVPLYLWYAPGAREAQVLPQVLTPALLAEHARKT